MKLCKNRAAAYVICFAAVVFSVFVLGGGKLSNRRQEAEQAFFEGENGYSAYLDLMESREYAANLVRIAKKAFPESKNYEQAEQLLEEYEEAGTPEEYYEIMEAMSSALLELQEELKESADGETFASADKQYVNYNAKMSNLKFDDSYNAKAKEYNALCGKFPAALIGAVTGNGPLPVFE